MAANHILFDVAGRPLPEAALRYAAAGVPVFPCWENAKNPATPNGFHDATADPSVVAAWWRRWPTANIGIPTGIRSGIDVVDVDMKASGNGFPAFNAARREGLVSGWLALVRTPSGGLHLYYPADPDVRQPSWQSPKAHVDFRGDGGYVIAPPSFVVTKDYKGIYDCDGVSPSPTYPVDGQALRAFLDPRPVPALGPRRVVPLTTDAERLASWVARRDEGGRNAGLFWASCRLSESGMSLPDMLDALSAAGENCGLPPREVETTIRSAYRATHLGAGTSRGSTATAAPVRHGRQLAGQVIA
jgi:hypothetical protein